MIQHMSRLSVADNSGAKQLMCIGIPGSGVRRYAGLGDIITCSVKDAVPNAQEAIRAGKVVRAVIVRVVKNTRRADGTHIRFDENAADILNEAQMPVGTRIFGPVARELREKGYMRIVSLAPEVV